MTNDHGKQQARYQLEAIREMLANYREAGTDERAERAYETIMESPLEVSMRSGWTNLNQVLIAEEYRILLCTGGPAVQIVGDLDEHGVPSCAVLQYQNWFAPWTEYTLHKNESEDLLEYARMFFPY